jgi:hypothetical protein
MLIVIGFFVYFLWPPVLWLFGGLFAVYYEVTTATSYSMRSKAHFAASVCKSLAFLLGEVYQIVDYHYDKCSKGVEAKTIDVNASGEAIDDADIVLQHRSVAYKGGGGRGVNDGGSRSPTSTPSSISSWPSSSKTGRCTVTVIG